MPGNESAKPVNVLIVADVRLYRDGLIETLAACPSLRIVGGAASRADAFAAIQHHKPDVAVVDMWMPGAFDLLREVRSELPDTRMVAFAVDEQLSTLVDCAAAGAAGYVTAEASVEELARAISRAAGGELLCPPRVAAELFRRMGELAEDGAAAGATNGTLTQREKEVLALLRPGLSNKAIASTLNISEATVKNHVHHVLAKLKVGKRQQAAARPIDSSQRKRRA